MVTHGRVGFRSPAISSGYLAAQGRRPPPTSIPRSIRTAAPSSHRILTMLNSPTGLPFSIQTTLKRHLLPTALNLSAATAACKVPMPCPARILSGRVGLALDPCAALQVPFDLAPGEETGNWYSAWERQKTDHTEPARSPGNSAGSMTAHESFENVKSFWKETVGAVRIETPDAALDKLHQWLA
jgi:hypothetical protein